MNLLPWILAYVAVSCLIGAAVGFAGHRLKQTRPRITEPPPLVAVDELRHNVTCHPECVQAAERVADVIAEVRELELMWDAS